MPLMNLYSWRTSAFSMFVLNSDENTINTITIANVNAVISSEYSVFIALGRSYSAFHVLVSWQSLQACLPGMINDAGTMVENHSGAVCRLVLDARLRSAYSA
ncbi:hypothetical protein D3C85_1306470 [compost metagenome]